MSEFFPFENEFWIKIDCKLLQGILSFFYTFIDLTKEEKEIKEIFLKFDKNHDGVLTKEEIISGC